MAGIESLVVNPAWAGYGTQQSPFLTGALGDTTFNSPEAVDPTGVLSPYQRHAAGEGIGYVTPDQVSSLFNMDRLRQYGVVEKPFIDQNGLSSQASWNWTSDPRTDPTATRWGDISFDLQSFDSAAYGAANPDLTPEILAASGFNELPDPLRYHWFASGMKEGRNSGQPVPEVIPEATPTETAPVQQGPTLPSNLPVNADFQQKGLNSLLDQTITQDPWGFFGSLFPAQQNSVAPTVFPENQNPNSQLDFAQNWYKTMFGNQIGVPALTGGNEVIESTPGKWGQVM